MHDHRTVEAGTHACRGDDVEPRRLGNRALVQLRRVVQRRENDKEQPQPFVRSLLANQFPVVDFAWPSYDERTHRLLALDPKQSELYTFLIANGGTIGTAERFVGPQTAPEVEAHVESRPLMQDARVLQLALEAAATIEVLFNDFKARVKRLPEKIDRALQRVNNIQDRQRVAKLQRELNERKESARLAWAFAEKGAKLMALREPKELAVNLIELAALFGEIATDARLEPIQEGIDKQREGNERREVDVAESELQELQAELTETDALFTKTRQHVAHASETLRQARADAEVAYDKQTKGQFRFAPLARRDDEVQAYAQKGHAFKDGVEQSRDLLRTLTQVPAKDLLFFWRYGQDEGLPWRTGEKAANEHLASLKAYGPLLAKRLAAVSGLIAKADAVSKDLGAQRFAADQALIAGANQHRGG
jgi:hypothetical protein